MRPIKAAMFALHSWLPPGAGNRLLTVWTNSRIRRFIRKRRAQKIKAIKAKAISEYGTVDAEEVARVLANHGVSSGDIVFVQCSFNDLYTFTSSPVELVETLQASVGPAGTLLMPAYTTGQSNAGRPFSSTRTPTYTGIVGEIFRRSTGVIRSLHPRHSICGRGPSAAWILADHESCLRADGPDSPFDRMRRLPNAKIVTLGLPLGHISFLHWVEDFEPGKLPFRVHESVPLTAAIEMPDGTVKSIEDWQIKSNVAARLSLASLFRKISPNACEFFLHKGIQIGVYSMMPLSGELLALRDQGSIHYR